MFRVRLAKILVLGSLGLSSGCLGWGDRPPLFDRFRNRCDSPSCCGEVSDYSGPVLQDYGPYPPGATITTVPGGAPSTGCPTLVPQGTPLPQFAPAPGSSGAPSFRRIDPQPSPTGNAPVQPYNPLPKD